MMKVMPRSARKVGLLVLVATSVACGAAGTRGEGAGGDGASASGGASAIGGGLSSAGMAPAAPPSGGPPTSTGGASSHLGGSSAAAGAAPSAGGSAGQAGGAAALSGAVVIYVGGFGADPLLAYDLDPLTGALAPHGGPIAAGSEPSCFALDPARKHLYVCNEDDGAGGGVTAFAIDAQGSLTRLNHQAGSDSGFTSLAVHPSGNWIAGASYSGGSASLFSLLPDGALGNEVGSADFGNQAQSHCVAYDPSGKFLLVPTKGNDQVQQLVLGEGGSLAVNVPASVASDPGSGPRHIAVHPNGKLAWVINERGSSITTYQLAEGGTLTRASSTPSIPADYVGQNTGAHIELAPSAGMLYVSNRGHDSLGAFAVSADTGALTLVEHEPSRGSAPHDFDIDEQGKLLAVINRKSSSLAVFAIAADGRLSALGEAIATRNDPTAVLIHRPR